MIEIKSVTKSYGDYIAIDDINITVEDSSVLGLAGFNGSGKTTLLNVCAGIFKPDEGSVLLDGKDAFDNDNERVNLFYLSDGFYFPISASIKTAAKFYANYFPNFDFKILNSVLDIFGLDIKKNVRSLSKGMKRQASLAIAFATKPKYLLIDETFDGLDPIARDYAKKMIAREVSDFNRTVILSSHNLTDIETICDSVALIDAGQLILHKTIDDIIKGFRKYQVIFSDKPIDLSPLETFATLPEVSGKLITFISSFEEEEVKEKLKRLSDSDILYFETVDLTLDEIFTLEVNRVKETKGGKE